MISYLVLEPSIDFKAKKDFLVYWLECLLSFLLLEFLGEPGLE